MARRRKLSTDEIRAILEWNLTQAEGFDGDEVSSNRERALDSYYGRKRTQEVKGRSTATSHDTADMLEAVVAQIMPAFDTERLGEFKANNKADIGQARTESAVVNSFIFDRNRGYTLIQEALRDALLLRNGIIKVEAQEISSTSTRRFKDLNAVEMFQVTQAPAENVEIDIVSATGTEAGVDLTTRETLTNRSLNVKAVDPTQFLISTNHDSIFLSDVDFCAERHFMTASDLVAMGFPRKVVDEIPSTSLDTKSDTVARNSSELSTTWDNLDKSLRMIEVFECYMRIDVDQDGIAERRKIIYAGGTSGGTILEMEEHPHVPYASGTPFLQPHRWSGLSLFDKLDSIEDIKTETLRNYIDNMNAGNNRRLIVVDGAVNIDDAVNSRPGGIVRADRIDAVQPIPVDDIGPSAQSLLNYMDKIRSERGGASLDLQAAELQLAGETASGIERQFTAKELLAQMISRTLGETLLRETFLITHSTMRLFFPDVIEVEVAGDFIQIRPSDWQPRTRMKMIAGLSAGERRQRKSALEALIMQQEKLAQAGLDGVLMSLDTYHAALVDWSEASGLPSADRYWISPNSQESQQAQQQKQQTQQQQAAEAERQQQQQFSALIGVEQQKTDLDAFKHSTQLRFDYWDRTLKSEIEELRITTEGDAEIDTDQEVGRDRAGTSEAA